MVSDIDKCGVGGDATLCVVILIYGPFSFQVYLDLSKAEAFESVNEHFQTQSLFRSASGRHLETIPQDEELQTEDIVRFSLLSERSVSTESTSSSSSFEDW